MTRKSSETPALDALKRKFREGEHAAAIAECEGLCAHDPGNHDLKKTCAMMHALVGEYPRALELLHEVHVADGEDADALFNIAKCERQLNDFRKAEGHYKAYTAKFPSHPDGWASLAECQFQLQAFNDGISSADRAIAIDAAMLPAWIVRGNCQRAIGRLDGALASYRKANQIRSTAEAWLNTGQVHLATGKPLEAVDDFTRAIQLAPDVPGLRAQRGDAFQRCGKMNEAVADYTSALELDASDEETLKKASSCLLKLHRDVEVIELCRGVLRVRPDMLTAKRGIDSVLAQLVPNWHVPMMNERERNAAYQRALESAVAPDKVVFEIGTGSGLLAMMAAKLGARHIYTCEMTTLIAETARSIVKTNGYQDRVTVLAKRSQTVQLPADLPARADILVHEIFSSDLLAEHLLPAIEDAKARLLKPGGVVLPAAASIMIALVGGAEIGAMTHVEESFGFDLREFNDIYPRMQPLYRQGLASSIMSRDVEAFRFDFAKDSTFPAEAKSIEIGVEAGGTCYGVIQWIRLEFEPGNRYENHPAQRRPNSNWENVIYRFERPVRLDAGSVVSVTAAHDRLRPWFELTSQVRRAGA